MGEHHRFDASRISLLSLGSFAYLVIIGALVGYTAYIFLLRHCDPVEGRDLRLRESRSSPSSSARFSRVKR